MSLGEAVHALLAAPNGAASALIGSRVFPLVAPAAAKLPRVVYTVVDAPPVRALRGRTGLTRARVQVDCWAETYREAQKVADRVVLILGERVGEYPRSALLDKRDGYEDETGLRRVSLDFQIWVKE